MYLKTWHGTLVVVGAQDNQLKHLPFAPALNHECVRLDGVFDQEAKAHGIPAATKIQSGPLEGYVLRPAQDGDGFNLVKEDFYLCAEPESDQLRCNRLYPNAWERFYFLTDVEPLVQAALTEYQLGNLQKSLSIWQLVQDMEPDNDLSALHIRLVKDLLLPSYVREPNYLVWQCRQDGMWEHEWVNYLVSNPENRECFDGRHSVFHKNMVVIDSQITASKASYYRNAFIQGCSILLIHLGDESFTDDYSAYQWCKSVWRNYWSPVISRMDRVRFFPLGYKTGFANSEVPKSASSRGVTWSFAGDIKKSSRSAMINCMNSVSGGVVHVTTSFGSSDSLSTVEYRKLMNNSIFVPCPAGWSNLDSFRVYECLEAGCIPIVEQRKGFDYFRLMYGPHPIPTVLAWSEAPELIYNIQSAHKEEEFRQSCYKWWQDIKGTVRSRIQGSMKNIQLLRV